MLQIKVIRIKKLVDSLIEFIRLDYEDKFTEGRPEDSFLERFVGAQEYEDADYKLLDEAKNIFLRGSGSPRMIRTGLMFPKNITPSPHVHVREPMKSSGTYNAIGGGYGGEYYLDGNGEVVEGFRDSKRASYEIVVTSNNPLDTILISEILYALMNSAQDSLNEEFDIYSFQLKELLINQDSDTPFLFVKAITIDSQYENSFDSIVDKSYLSKVIFNYPNIQ